MICYKWILESVTLAIHDAQIAEHGGMPGVRDITLLRCARNHPFNDGNRRTAFVVTELFLTLNGYRLLAEDIASVLTMLAVASGEISEDQFADWIRNHIENI